MAKNDMQIVIDLAVKNKQALKQLQGDLTGLKGKTDKAQVSTGSIAKGFIAAQVAMQAFSGAINIGVSAVKAFASQASSAIDASANLERQLTTLEIISKNYGFANGEATESAKQLSDELGLGLGATAEGLQKLFKSGLSVDQASNLMRRFTNEALTGKDASLSLDQAVQNLAGGYQMEISALMDRAGISENISTLLDKQADKEGVVVSKLDEKARAQLKYKAFVDLTNETMGASEQLAGNLQIREAKLTNETEKLKVKMGEMLMPMGEMRIGMKQLANEGVGTLINNFASFIEKNNYLKNVTDKLSVSMQGLGNYIKNKIIIHYEAFKKGVEENKIELETAMIMIRTDVIPAFKNLTDTIFGSENSTKTFAEKLMQAIPVVINTVTNIIKMIDALIKVGKWLADVQRKHYEFAQALAGLNSQLHNIGKNIIAGFLRGLDDGWDSVVAWTDKKAGWVADFFRLKNKIKSPSVIFKDIGKYLMQGLKLGLQDGFTEVRFLANNIVSELQTTFRSVTGGQFTKLDIDSSKILDGMSEEYESILREVIKLENELKEIEKLENPEDENESKKLENQKLELRNEIIRKRNILDAEDEIHRQKLDNIEDENLKQISIWKSEIVDRLRFFKGTEDQLNEYKLELEKKLQRDIRELQKETIEAQKSELEKSVEEIVEKTKTTFEDLKNTANRIRVSDSSSVTGTINLDSFSEFARSIVGKFASQDLSDDKHSERTVLYNKILNSDEYKNSSSGSREELRRLVNAGLNTGSGFQDDRLTSPRALMVKNTIKKLAEDFQKSQELVNEQEKQAVGQNLATESNTTQISTPTVVRSINIEKIAETLNLSGDDPDSIVDQLINKLIKKLELNIY